MKRHIAFILPGKAYAPVHPSESFTCQAALIQQELLSNIEQS